MANNTLLDKLDRSFAVISDWSWHHRGVVLIASLLLVIASLYLAVSVRMDNSFESFFNADDVAYGAYRQYRGDFGSDEIAYLLYDASAYEHGVFDLALMQKIRHLTGDLENGLPFVQKVRSLSNAELIVGVEDGIEVLRLDEDFPSGQAELSRFGEQFLKKPLYIGGLVSADGRYGAIQIDMARSSVDALELIRLDPAGGDGLENLYPQATDAALSRILAQPEYRDIAFHVTGDVPVGSAFNRMVTSDMNQALVLCLLLVIIVLGLFFRGYLWGVVGPVVIVILTIILTFGFMGMAGWHMDMMFSMMPALIIAIGVCESVHIISTFQEQLAVMPDRRQALQQTLRMVGTPCLLTTLTTAAGFFSLSLSPIKAIAHMSVYSAVAVIAAFVLSVLLLPFFLSLGKRSPALVGHARETRFNYWLAAVTEFDIRHGKAIMLVGLIVVLSIGAGMSRLVVDSNFLLDFHPDAPVRLATEAVDNTMGGSGSLVYLFDSGRPDGIKNPALLRQMDAFQQEAAQQAPFVKKTWALPDIIKDIHQSFHNADPAFYAIPDDPELIAQYLLVYEMSGGEELRDLVSADYSSAIVDVRTRMSSSSEVEKLRLHLEGWLLQHPVEQADVKFTGIGALWVQLVDYITQSQISGVVTGFVVIALIMSLLFGSLKVGLVCMIPNVVPVVIMLGFIGWAGLPLDYMKLLIAPIAIGIAVDDTIHLMTRLHYEFLRCRNYAQALHAALQEVGRALVTSTVVLVAGFSVFCFSQMDSQFWFGALLSGTLALALVTDFLLMPVLVLWLKPWGAELQPVTERPAGENG